MSDVKRCPLCGNLTLMHGWESTDSWICSRDRRDPGTGRFGCGAFVLVEPELVLFEGEA